MHAGEDDGSAAEEVHAVDQHGALQLEQAPNAPGDGPHQGREEGGQETDELIEQKGKNQDCISI